MADDRTSLARAFADTSGWEGARMVIIAGDASNRKYYRLTDGHRSAILMDAPPEKGEDTRPFIHVARFLTSIGLSAPQIFEADTDQGILLIEDFGDDLFARLLAQGAADEQELYTAATEVLLHLHAKPPPELAGYTSGVMADMAALSVTWYRRGVTGEDRSDLHDKIHKLMATALRPLDDAPKCLIQRDYHAENLLWLPERTGVARVGLLDFQDAMLGHRAYDLVSVLQDARRDVPAGIETEMCQRYVADAGANAEGFMEAYSLLGLQRNLRILGVFARLCIRDGKQSYVDLIPRVWGHILTNLNALNRADLTDAILSTLPEPTPARLTELKAQCPTPS